MEPTPDLRHWAGLTQAYVELSDRSRALIANLTRAMQVSYSLIEAKDPDSAAELLWRVLQETEAARLELEDWYGE
jgi:hypothetical protein